MSIILIPVALIFLFYFRTPPPEDKLPASTSHTIAGIVQPEETLESIFHKHNLDKTEMVNIYQSSRKEYDLSKISVGNIYVFEVDREINTIQGMKYGINDLSFLSVLKRPDGFEAEKIELQPEIRTGAFYVEIKDNLILSMPGSHREYHKLALALSEIYAWDIDFSSDIRSGDSVKIIIEELWVGAVFMGYGNILAAEFMNNGKAHFAYRFEHDGYADYYDREGKSLRKALLRSPLKFKYISSHFTRRRLHPVLRRYRPHLGVDYAAPTGTPVSASGNGTVLYAGYRGQMGKMVKIKHPGGYVTYYGHLSRIPRKIRRGTKVSQGDIIGYVGSTGLSTGPHLDYRIKVRGKFVNPLKIQLPRGKPVPKSVMAKYKIVLHSLDSRLASLTRPVVALEEKKKSASG